MVDGRITGKSPGGKLSGWGSALKNATVRFCFGQQNLKIITTVGDHFHRDRVTLGAHVAVVIDHSQVNVISRFDLIGRSLLRDTLVTCCLFSLFAGDSLAECFLLFIDNLAA